MYCYYLPKEDERQQCPRLDCRIPTQRKGSLKFTKMTPLKARSGETCCTTEICLSHLRAYTASANTRNGNGGKVRTADLHPQKMLRDARMAGSVKLHRSARPKGEGRVWAATDVEYLAITLLILRHRWAATNPKRTNQRTPRISSTVAKAS